MKRTRTQTIVAATALGLLLLPGLVLGRIVTRDEARNIASNYIELVVAATGSWGEAPAASVGGIEELRRGDRLLGYWCHVAPAGHVVVSVHDALAPVKASSEMWDGDPACAADIVDVIAWKIEQEHLFIEERVGPVETAPTEAVAALCEIDYRGARATLARDAGDFRRSEMLSGALLDYQSGGVMLSTIWDQIDPYNLYMPATNACSAAYDDRCAAGCVAIAAAQIMKYWCWPPVGYGVPYENNYYEWTLMPDHLTPSSPHNQIEATALLILHAGMACDMDYCHDGGCASSAYHADMRLAYIANFRFNSGTFLWDRTSLPSSAWFDLIRLNLDQNMPLQYGIPDHSIVCDGWRIVSDIKQYHMNYGWAGGLGSGDCWAPYQSTGSNTWFTLDALPCTNLAEEDCIAALKPWGSLDETLAGTYMAYADFPYRYVNVDTGGENAVFESGQLIQALPGRTIRCTSAGTGAVRFYGTTGLHTRLYTRGDTSKGVKITGGCVALYGGGGVLIH